jgi:hypothetical protein
MSSANFSLPYQRLDWHTVQAMPPEDAAVALDRSLRALDGLSKRIFIERGLILMEVESRRLWEHLDDSDGTPYHSFEQWVCSAADYSRRDCFYALAAAKELRDIPVRELSQMTRSNIEVMKTLSRGVRQKLEVIEAAKSLPEREFVEKIQMDYPTQHIEQRQAVIMPKEDCAEFEAAIKRSMDRGAMNRGEAIRDISVNYLLDFPAEDERSA